MLQFILSSSINFVMSASTIFGFLRPGYRYSTRTIRDIHFLTRKFTFSVKILIAASSTSKLAPPTLNNSSTFKCMKLSSSSKSAKNSRFITHQLFQY